MSKSMDTKKTSSDLKPRASMGRRNQKEKQGHKKLGCSLTLSYFFKRGLNRSFCETVASIS